MPFTRTSATAVADVLVNSKSGTKFLTTLSHISMVIYGHFKKIEIKNRSTSYCERFLSPFRVFYLKN